jgi:hypothetical protein
MADVDSVTINVVDRIAPNSSVAHAIDWVFEQHYDDIANELDTIASKNGLTSQAITDYVRNWEFDEYYEDWIREGWE